MVALRRALFRLLSGFRSGRAEADLAREIEAHLRLLEDKLLAQGMSARDARDAARRAFGGVEQAKEHQRDSRSFRWLTGWRLDRELARGCRSFALAELIAGLAAREVAIVVAYMALMVGGCVLACIVPARRALRIEPTGALRTDR